MHDQIMQFPVVHETVVRERGLKLSGNFLESMINGYEWYVFKWQLVVVLFLVGSGVKRE